MSRFLTSTPAPLTCRRSVRSIETSALDASNVETAFQTILTGALSPFRLFRLVSGADVLLQQKSTASFRRSSSRRTPSRLGQATAHPSRSPRRPMTVDKTRVASAAEKRGTRKGWEGGPGVPFGDGGREVDLTREKCGPRRERGGSIKVGLFTFAFKSVYHVSNFFRFILRRDSSPLLRRESFP